MDSNDKNLNPCYCEPPIEGKSFFRREEVLKKLFSYSERVKAEKGKNGKRNLLTKIG
jgi:hypothetical protein